MAESFPKSKIDSSRPVLIIGAGVVGLTLAQGCREAGIPFQIFERFDVSTERTQGWGLTLHWCLPSLERMQVDPSVEEKEGCFLFLNASNCEAKYKVLPKARLLRAGRKKLRTVLTSGLDIQYEKSLSSFETLDSREVIARFQDGTSVKGGLLVGADGSNSVVREGLKFKNPKLTLLPVNLVGVTRHLTPEQAAPLKALNPLLFFALHPETGTFFFFGIQEAFPESDGRNSYDAMVGISWKVEDAEKDAIPKTPQGQIAEMKRRAKGFAEPLLGAVMDIPDDHPFVKGFPLADFPGDAWDNLNGLVTLAGDSGHAMTMYRGEGANHGILDAALLLDQIKRIYAGEISQTDGLKIYEAEMQERGHAAVLMSRQASLDAHDWDVINEKSPLIGGRTAPPKAFGFS